MGSGKNQTTAGEWYNKAAKQGYAEAQYNLGMCYEKGESMYIVKDLSKAVYWYKKAAEQGEANAQCSLGLSYYFGEGVEKDQKKAVYWLTKAAEQGNEGAQSALGNLRRLYDREKRGEKDLPNALRWYAKYLRLKIDNAPANTCLEAYNTALNYYPGIENRKEAQALRTEMIAANKPIQSQKPVESNIHYHVTGSFFAGNVGVLAKDDAVVNRANIGEEKAEGKENIFCPDCGRKLPVDARFCMGCGKQLK